MRMPAVWLVVALGGWSGTGWAQGPVPNVNDGRALQLECASALRAADARRTEADAPPATVDVDEPPEVDDVERGYRMGQCLGLVSAVWHTHMMMVDEFDGRVAFCPSTTLSPGEMARLVDRYLRDHPAELSDWDTVLIMRAFMAEFPCGRRP